MTVRVSVAITHLPGRDKWLPAMLEALAGVPIAVVEDRDREGCWPTVKRAWSVRPPDATHHAVFSDDLLVCRDFARTVARVVAAVPRAPVAPFCANGIVHKAAEAGGAWALTFKTWGVANVLPVGFIDDFLAWDAANCRPDYKHDDSRLVAYALTRNVRFWNTVPSLVEHDGANESTLGNHPPIDRRARRWIGRDASPLRIDWTAGREAPPVGAPVALSAYRDVFLDPAKWIAA